MMLAMLVPCWTGVVGEEGEFMAGSFILTQRALDEAPYRYSSFLTQALEKMEMKDPPTKEDKENCNVKYKIEPSGEGEPESPVTNGVCGVTLLTHDASLPTHTHTLIYVIQHFQMFI